MKVWKMAALAALVVAIGLVAAAPALAEEPADAAPTWQRWFRGIDAKGECAFVDEDGDGLCDVCGRAPGASGEFGSRWGLGADGERPFVDEDGDGLCDVCGRAPGECDGERARDGEGDGPRGPSADGRSLAQGVRGGMMRGSRSRQ